MAQLFLEEAKPGKGTSHGVPIEVAIDKLTPFEKKYFDAPPEVTTVICHDAARARMCGAMNDVSVTGTAATMHSVRC